MWMTVIPVLINFETHVKISLYVIHVKRYRNIRMECAYAIYYIIIILIHSSVLIESLALISTVQIFNVRTVQMHVCCALSYTRQLQDACSAILMPLCLMVYANATKGITLYRIDRDDSNVRMDVQVVITIISLIL